MRLPMRTVPWMLFGVGLMLLTLPCEVSTGEFRAFFNHNHTIYSLDNEGWEAFKPSVGHVISKADRVASDMGLEGAIAITDHDNINAWFDPEFVPVGVAQPIRGEEWGSGGHAGVLNFSGDTPITHYTGPDRYTQLVAEVHTRGGIVIANHPRSNDWQTDRRLGIDAIEVWNVLLWEPSDKLTLAWWQRLLAAGEQVTGVGGSDAHFVFTPIEAPMNLVWCESNDPDEVMNGVRDGRVLVLLTPAAPTVFPAADSNGDGLFDDAIVGDVIPISDTQTVAFQMVVEGAGETDLLLLYDRTGEFYSGSVGSDPDWEDNAYTFSRTYSDFDRDFVRAELRTENRSPYCLTNPIYIVGDYAPTGTEGEVRGTVRDEGGLPLEGATITVSPGEYSTDVTAEDGTYTVLVPNGTYRVEAAKTGFVTQAEIDVAVESGVSQVDFALATSSCGTLPVDPGAKPCGFLVCGLSSLFPFLLACMYLTYAVGRARSKVAEDPRRKNVV